MPQSKLESLAEVSVNVIIGWGTGLTTQIIVFPLLGIQATLDQQLQASVVFVVVSVIRGYIIRRWFNSDDHAMIVKFMRYFTKKT